MAALPKCVAQKVSPIRCSKEKKGTPWRNSFGKSYITLTTSWGCTVDVTMVNGNIKAPKKFCCK